MTLPTDYIDGDVLTAADVNAITTAVNGNIPASTIAAKGDLLVGLTNDSVGVLTAGTNGYLLSSSSGATSGLEWVAPGGKVLQHVTDIVNTTQSTTSTSLTDITGLSISFTPLSASSTLVCSLTGAAVITNTSLANTDARIGDIAINHDGTQYKSRVGRFMASASTNGASSQIPFTILVAVSSGSTSARTIKGQFAAQTDNTTELYGANLPILLTVTEYL